MNSGIMSNKNYLFSITKCILRTQARIHGVCLKVRQILICSLFFAGISITLSNHKHVVYISEWFAMKMCGYFIYHELCIEFFLKFSSFFAMFSSQNREKLKIQLKKIGNHIVSFLWYFSSTSTSSSSKYTSYFHCISFHWFVLFWLLHRIT